MFTYLGRPGLPNGAQGYPKDAEGSPKALKFRACFRRSEMLSTPLARRLPLQPEVGKQDVFDVELQQRLRKLCEGALLANEAAVQSKIVGELELCLDYFRDHVRVALPAGFTASPPGVRRTTRS